MKVLSPKQARIAAHMKKMKAAGITDDQIRASANKVRAQQAAAKQPGNVLDYRQLKKEYVQKKNTPAYKQQAPATGLSPHAQNQMGKMTPRPIARKAGLGTNFNPTPIDPTKTKKPF